MLVQSLLDTVSSKKSQGTGACTCARAVMSGRCRQRHAQRFHHPYLTFSSAAPTTSPVIMERNTARLHACVMHVSTAPPTARAHPLMQTCPDPRLLRVSARVSAPATSPRRGYGPHPHHPRPLALQDIANLLLVPASSNSTFCAQQGSRMRSLSHYIAALLSAPSIHELAEHGGNNRHKQALLPAPRTQTDLLGRNAAPPRFPLSLLPG
jgi:hypothetical protein